VLLDPTVDRAGFSDLPTLDRTIAEHLEGSRVHGFILWKALNLEVWIRQYGINPLAD